MYEFFLRLLRRQEIRFLLVGGANTLFSAIFILVLQRLLGDLIPPQAIFATGIFLCSIQSYFAMRLIVFKSRENFAREYIKYFLAVTINLVSGVLFMTCLVDFLGMNAYSAHCLNILFLVALAYVSLKYFAFKKARETKIIKE